MSNKGIVLVLAFIAFIGILAILAYSMASNHPNYIYHPIVNNTDLGFGMGGNEERLPNITYFANKSDIDLYLIGHVVGTGGREMFEFNISIDGTMVQDTLRDRTISTGLHEHFPQKAHIPKGSNYSVMNSSTVEGIEWREYPYAWVKN